METVAIEGATGRSRIMIGERLANLSAYIPLENTVIVTDRNVRHYYHAQFPPCRVITIDSGERIKNLATVQDLYAQLVEMGADRTTVMVGVGGGIVCDITGFVASTYLRGVRFGFVPSTLLAQVDASVGGKNGVNFAGYKNIIGVFSQPEFVICDMALLQTLPQKELLCGFAEIVKHAAIADAGLFDYLERHYQEAMRLNPAVMQKLVYDSVIIKADVVNRDEKEKGERRKLNFGHTFGHALEKVTGMAHGEAVSAGMVTAAVLSARRNLLVDHDVGRLCSLLSNLKLPTRIRGDHDALLDALGKDKKKEGDRIKFVLLQKIGQAVVDEITLDELRQSLGLLMDGQMAQS